MILAYPGGICATASEGDAVCTIDHYVEGMLAALKNYLHQHHHVGNGNRFVTVGVGVLNHEIADGISQDIIHQCHHVCH